jgi:hypothetical protein
MLGYFRAAPAAYEINQQGDHAMTTPETNPNIQNAVRYKTVRIELSGHLLPRSGPLLRACDPAAAWLSNVFQSSNMYRNLIPRLANLDNCTLLSEGW